MLLPHLLDKSGKFRRFIRVSAHGAYRWPGRAPVYNPRDLIVTLGRVSGHKSERHKAAFKHALETAGEVVSPQRYSQILLQVL